MPITHIASLIANGTANGSNVTLDSTGANLIVVSVHHYATVASPLISDSRGNVWVPLTRRKHTNSAIRQYYCLSPVVGPSHVFTSAGNGQYHSISVRCFAGVLGFASEVGAVGSGLSLNSGDITPTLDGSLLVASGTFDGTSTEGSTYGGLHKVGYTVGAAMGGASAYQIQSTAVPSSNTFSGSIRGRAISLACFTAVDGDPVPVNDFTMDDAGIFLSPYNWRLSGSAYAETNNPGAYIKTKFTGASCTLLIDTTNQSGLSAGNYPAVSWQVNGGAWQRSQITAGQTTLSLATGLGAGPHTLEIVVTGAWWSSDRWTTPVSALRITGLRLAASATLSPPTLQTGRMIVFADSNGEGYEALASGVSVTNQDASQAFPLLIAKALGCEVGVIAFAGQGYNANGGGNVPDVEDSWDLYSAGNTRLSSGLLSPAPDYILSTHGQNDSSGTQAASTSCITQWLAATPETTKITIIAPMNQNQITAIEAAVTAAANNRVKHINVGSMSSCPQYVNSSHLSLRGHAVYAALIVGAIKSAFGEGN